MNLREMNWMQVEAYLEADDRIVVPLGSTEQHAYLSLFTDAILAERVALDACAPLGVPVCPVVPYGMTPRFLAYPGTISLRRETYLAVLEDLVSSLHGQGFRRFVFVNGHGGNTPICSSLSSWFDEHIDCEYAFHDWWRAPETWRTVIKTDPVAMHASWMENFPWTRLAGILQPENQKPAIRLEQLQGATPEMVRSYLGDGNFGGCYERTDAEMHAIWAIAVEETRQIVAAI
ncbi:putative creatinine amidohydrolase [Acetobacter nitrogenifigens DSM 23921 = NBRC 105050]|uniref:Amidase n=1 Tax=Acetobacter nitrogenifigens DSM 23921 = NBRC 105050 TaxID=1120919 RepID=A0A511XER7_9PROT|nr:creatininase family protein [Acetobacter nitrogenifigens]GBQ94747.1 putative creatinine amidohydrolase [Acetobacter nitrogenifigens DSM 23921 = NBRC 105050]GEN61391.1 amidase [Acetobacter nitrogenifigens DSM 23921 = NBRC 105050]